MATRQFLRAHHLTLHGEHTVSPLLGSRSGDKLGSNLEAPDIKRELQLWIDQYTNAGAIGNEQRAKNPSL
ncbi:hypothetical protein O9993_05850 [Vibrio lentus]|nr:hypothetical protein [Vibrio lentus]